MSDSSAADGPFEEQRQIYDLLSQETRHLSLQFILGHPANLPSLDELAHMIPKNKAAIRDQLQVLVDADIIARYDHPPNEDARDLPSQFYGFTEYGVDVLEEYNYLSGLPVAKAVYARTRLSDRAQRHQEAPRPSLPEGVAERLSLDEPRDSFDSIAGYIQERKSNTHSVDDQIALLRAFYDAGSTPDAEGVKRSELGEITDADLEYTARTMLKHLVDLGLLSETTPPGPDVFAISEQRDEIVNGHVTEEAERNVAALIEHIDDELQPVTLDESASELSGADTGISAPSVAVADGAGRSIRSILALEFGVAPEQVPETLRSGDPVDRLNTAVDAIEAAEEVTTSEQYGRIVFVRQAYRYRLTEQAMELIGS